MSAKPSQDCPCCSGRPYADCCSRYHAGPLRLAAPDAEALMRSRYSAFALGLHDYLLQTWHPGTRPAAIGPIPPGVKWLGMEVRGTRRIDDDHAQVEFVARSRIDGRGQRLHETSRFVRQGGRWYYVDGDLHGTGSPRSL